MKSLNEKNKIKSLEDFIRLANSDKDLQGKIKNAKNVDELIKIAKEAGYAASKEERKKLMSFVAGGVGEEVIDPGMSPTETSSSGAVAVTTGDISADLFNFDFDSSQDYSQDHSSLSISSDVILGDGVHNVSITTSGNTTSADGLAISKNKTKAKSKGR